MYLGLFSENIQERLINQTIPFRQNVGRPVGTKESDEQVALATLD